MRLVVPEVPRPPPIGPRITSEDQHWVWVTLPLPKKEVHALVPFLTALITAAMHV